MKKLKLKQAYKVFKHDDCNRYGVCDINGKSVLYDADMPYEMASALAKLYNSSNPPADWEEAKRKLAVRGINVTFEASIPKTAKIAFTADLDSSGKVTTFKIEAPVTATRSMLIAAADAFLFKARTWQRPRKK